MTTYTPPHEHEFYPAVIESAEWVGSETPISDEELGTLTIVDGRPSIFKQGTATFRHTCKTCGFTERWKV